MTHNWKWISQIGAALTVAVGTAGCAYFSKAASVQTAVSDQGGPEKVGKVAVPLFLHEKYKTGKGEKVWPDSAITDRFVTGLIQHGYHVLDRARIRKIMRENSIHPEELYSENNIQKIGMLLHADTVVLGKLTLVEKADGSIHSRKLNIRAIRVVDGAVVFSISSLDTTLYRVLTGEDLVDQGIADIFAANKTDNAKTAATAEGGATSDYEKTTYTDDGEMVDSFQIDAKADAAFGEEGRTSEADFESGDAMSDVEVEPDSSSASKGDSIDEEGLYVNPEDEPPVPADVPKKEESDTSPAP